MDVTEVALRLGVRVLRKPLPRGILGVTNTSAEVAIATGLQAQDARFVLAHELGHVLARRNEAGMMRSREEECFADAFARELLLPANLLLAEEIERITALSQEYDVWPEVTALQFANIGRLPDIMRNQAGGVLCVHCGSRTGLTSCTCLRFRQRPDLPLPMAPMAA
jgi:Zn-dependent peptidase ImmA (M78 family)